MMALSFAPLDSNFRSSEFNFGKADQGKILKYFSHLLCFFESRLREAAD